MKLKSLAVFFGLTVYCFSTWADSRFEVSHWHNNGNSEGLWHDNSHIDWHVNSPSVWHETSSTNWRDNSHSIWSHPQRDNFSFFEPIEKPLWHNRHNNYRFFHEHDQHIWHTGHWYNGLHERQSGWWWIVNGGWYYYPSRVAVIPDPYLSPTVTIVENPAPIIVQQNSPGPSAPNWYYCNNPQGYYPYIANCPEGWQSVPANPPPPPPTDVSDS